MRGDPKKTMHTIAAWAALVLSLILFTASGIMQVNAWSVNKRVDSNDAKIDKLIEIVSGLAPIVNSNATAINRLTDIVMGRR